MCPAQQLFIRTFYKPGKAGVFDCLKRFVESLAAFGKIARREDGIDDFEKILFVSFEIHFAAGGTANIGFREQ